MIMSRMKRSKKLKRQRRMKTRVRIFSMLLALVFIVGGTGGLSVLAEDEVSTPSTVESTVADITGTITWAEEAPGDETVYLQLYQGSKLYGIPAAIDGKIDESLATDGSGELAAWKYTWKGMPVTDASNAAYTYTIKEVDSTGADNTPSGYTKAEAGLKVTNTKIAVADAISTSASAPEEPVVVPEEPVIAPEEPVVAPEEPVVAPEEPVVVPEEPVVAPEEPVVAPEAPVVDPEEPVVTPEEPVVTPGETGAAPAITGTAVEDYSEPPSTKQTSLLTPALGIYGLSAPIQALALNGSGGSTYIVDPSTPDTSLLPGQVKITKEATTVAGKVNTWDIKLRVVGRNKSVTSDIVVIIDRSGSMSTSVGGVTRIQAAKAAANSFVDTVLTADPVNTRIAVVSFAGLVNNTGNTPDLATDANFTNNTTTLHNAINPLTANGGTLTQAAVRQAQTLLAGSTATKKTIILLSDGEPTYSYAINSLSQTTDFVSYNQTYLRNHIYNSNNTQTGNIPYVTRSDLASSRYNYSTVVGFGNASFCRAFSSPDTYYYSHGNSTIAQAGYAKAAGNTIYTISLYAGDYGTSVLNSVASPGKAYASDNAGLQAIFQSIAGQLGSAISSAAITDPMASGFFINNTGTIVKTNGTTAYDSGTKILTWNFNSLTQVLDPSHTDIKYEQLTYRIEISSNTPTDLASYPTNGITPMSFYDVDGAYCTNNFLVPTVDPVFVTVDKVLLDVAGNPKSSTNTFTVNISNGSGFSQNVVVTPDDNPIATLKQVWDAGTYTVAENASNPADRYTVTSIKVNNVTQSTIALAIGGNDQNIVITNKDAATTVTANKVWNGGPTAKPDTWFKLYRQAGSGGTVEEVPAAEAPIKNLAGGTAPVTSVTWSNLTKYNASGVAYIFSVKEVTSTGADFTPAGYTKTENGLIVTNTYKPSLIISKADGTTPLAGAVFALYTGTSSGPVGDPIGSATTGSDGKAGFGQLADGTYWLVETQPPTGYKWINNPIGPFIVANGTITGPAGYTPAPDGTTGNYIVTIQNVHVTDLPKAGGMGAIPFVAGGFGLMMLAMFRERRKRS